MEMMGELYLPLEGLVDVAAEKARLTKELEKIESESTKAEQKLAIRILPKRRRRFRRAQKRLAEWQAKKDTSCRRWRRCRLNSPLPNPNA